MRSADTEMIWSGRVGSISIENHTSEMLKDRSQLQNGRFLSQSEKVKGRQNEEDRSEIKHEQAFLARVASIGVGHVLEQKGEGQEIAFEGKAHPGVIDRRVRLLQHLLH